jgi:uncharacterized protein
MPTTPTYPGVYIEEIASGVRTIVGVATSITAFLGTAAKGPIDQPVTVFSFSDFSRQFGDLDVDYPMSYAVRDFFANGGGQAVIARLYAAPAAGTGLADLTVGGLKLVASSPGPWADALLARVDHDVSKDVATSFGLTEGDLFNLSVRLGEDGPLETFLNLTVKESPRRVDRVLAAGSAFVRTAPGALPAAVPTANDPPKKNDPPLADDSPWGPTATKVTAKGVKSGPIDILAFQGDRDKRTGKYLLEGTDLFNIMCIVASKRDESVAAALYADALGYCVERRAFLVVDAPVEWTHADAVSKPATLLTGLGLSGTAARNAAVYYPRVRQADPLRGGQIDTFPASGAIAGTMARTDGQRGVWKAAAGIDASITGLTGLADDLTDPENGVLNQVGINCLRTFPVYGRVVWGARTLRGADQAADEYKYIPIRRTALFLEESLYRGLKWVVFEPNDEPLWAQIRLNVGAFMQSLFRQGAFQGTTPREAYFVKCDKDTTTQDDRNKGIVNIVVGFAPLKPAEFVIVKLQQIAGQIDV